MENLISTYLSWFQLQIFDSPKWNTLHRLWYCIMDSSFWTCKSRILYHHAWYDYNS